MDKPAHADLSRELAGAFDWWRDAGVDLAFTDEPRSWTSPEVAEEEPGPRVRAQDPAAPGTVTGQPPVRTPAREAWPQDLASFREWWLAEPFLDGGRVSGRVPPRGPQAPRLMVIVAEPEREDRDELLSGPHGRLLEAMFSAMEIEPARIYFASLLPRHMPAADWQALVASEMGEVLLHHIVLAAPEALLVFGGNILPLFGNDPPQGPAVLREFNHEGLSVPLLAASGVQSFLERPGWKAELWKAWLDWTG